jgi:cell division septum initiation protein DivIVA
MAQSSSRSTDFDRALGDAKKQAENVASAFSEAAQDVYGQARDSAADIAGTANEAARTTMAHSKRRSAPPWLIRKGDPHHHRDPTLYGCRDRAWHRWLLGRMHRPF